MKVYLDNAATTPILDEVAEAMMNVLKNNFGNPSSTHSIGQEARNLVEENRRKIAKFLNVTPGEIIFTSCGTEANNLILKSAITSAGVERIITSKLEHKCVTETVLDISEHSGVEIVYLENNKLGDVDLHQLEHLLKDNSKKTLVSLMHANNEIGNLLDLNFVSKLCKQYNALFHSDTVQTMAHLNLDFKEIPVDFASCSAHKFHGPKGVGFAFIRKSTGLKAQIHGGNQERNLRAGTENVAGIVGLGKAFEISVQNIEDFSRQIHEVKDYTIEQLLMHIPDIKFNGRSSENENSLYTILSVLLPKNSPLIGLQLDMKGVAVSQGSACSSGAVKASDVISSVVSEEDVYSKTPLRISFSHKTTKEEIDHLVISLKEILTQIQ